ncbi:MAG: sigma-70 family RNA polymerase sigma factor [Verrucomicrobiales bacterium]|nr:sigma-70 family RNA polymerase sigma factor [Verrucomicrobiales bacterium]
MPDDADALSHFVERLTAAQGALHACIYTLMAGAPDAADVLQETNRVLWRKAAEYDPARPFLPWAYRVSHFQVLAHRQRVARERLVFDEELVGRLAEEFAGQSTAGERELRALEECLQKLPPAHRELVDARYQRGESVNDIAARRGRPANAVSALLYRIRNALAECIRQALAAEEPA